MRAAAASLWPHPQRCGTAGGPAAAAGALAGAASQPPASTSAGRTPGIPPAGGGRRCYMYVTRDARLVRQQVAPPRAGLRRQGTAPGVVPGMVVLTAASACGSRRWRMSHSCHGCRSVMSRSSDSSCRAGRPLGVTPPSSAVGQASSAGAAGVACRCHHCAAWKLPIVPVLLEARGALVRGGCSGAPERSSSPPRHPGTLHSARCRMKPGAAAIHLLLVSGTAVLGFVSAGRGALVSAGGPMAARARQCPPAHLVHRRRSSRWRAFAATPSNGVCKCGSLARGQLRAHGSQQMRACGVRRAATRTAVASVSWRIQRASATRRAGCAAGFASQQTRAFCNAISTHRTRVSLRMSPVCHSA